MESKYKVTEGSGFFRVDAPDRHGFRVECDGYQLRLIADGIDQPQYAPEFGLFEFRRLTSWAANVALAEWKAPIPQKSRFSPVRWAQQQARKAFSRHLYQPWRNLLARCEPTVLDVQRALFGSFPGRIPTLLGDPRLYQNRYIVSDLLKYRAARLVAISGIVNTMLSPFITDGLHDSVTDQALDRLSHWMACYAPNGQVYRSLARTLMALPGNLPVDTPDMLALVRLPYPVTDRVQLMAVMFATRHWRGNATAVTETIFRSTPEQVREGLRRVARYSHYTVNFRQFEFVRQMVGMCMDYPGPFTNASFVGLADQVVDWHRDETARRLENELRRSNPETPTARPPIALPDNPEIKFLSSVGEVAQEGIEMGHCIGGYADYALNGQCFLFHIDYQGERASAEVNRAGQVTQVQGPHNRPNAATQYGKRVLGRWVKTWPDCEQVLTS